MVRKEARGSQATHYITPMQKRKQHPVHEPSFVMRYTDRRRLGSTGSRPSLDPQHMSKSTEARLVVNLDSVSLGMLFSMAEWQRLGCHMIG